MNPSEHTQAVSRQSFIGYKLHVVVSLEGFYHSMELTKDSVYDSRYLKEIKYSGLWNCLLLADKGYLSSQGQRELFHSKGSEFKIQMRKNQDNYRPWPKIFKNARRRIEITFSKLSD